MGGSELKRSLCLQIGRETEKTQRGLAPGRKQWWTTVEEATAASQWSEGPEQGSWPTRTASGPCSESGCCSEGLAVGDTAENPQNHTELLLKDCIGQLNMDYSLCLGEL